MVLKIPYVEGLGIDDSKNVFILLEDSSSGYTSNDIIRFNSFKNNESIKLLQGEHEIERTKLSWILMAKHKLFLPEENKSDVVLYQFVKSSVKKMSTAVSKVNDYVILFKVPIYCRIRYRLIPEFPKYGIDENGVIIELETQKILPVLYKDSPNKDVYASVRLKSNIDDSVITRSIHKLMAVTWVNNADWENNTVINFKDGDKNNYKASNLEWTNRAGKTNSSSDENNSAIKLFDNNLKDSDINNIKIFDSLTDTFRFIGKTVPNGIGAKMSANGGYDIVQNRYEIRFQKDPRDFILKTRNIEDVLKDLRDKKFNQIYYAINILTKKEIIGTSAVLSKEIGKKNNEYISIMEAEKSIKDNWIVVREEDYDSLDISLYKDPENKPKQVRTTYLKVNNGLTEEEVKIHHSVIAATKYIIKKTGKHTTKKTVGKQTRNNGYVHGIKLEFI